VEDGLGAYQTVVVLGAASEVARQTLRRLVGRRTRHVVLAARQPDAVRRLADELRSRGASTVDCVPFDPTEAASVSASIARAIDPVGDLDLVLVTLGLRGDRGAGDGPTDGGAAASALTALAPRLRAQGHGAVVVVSSFARAPGGADDASSATPTALDACARILRDELAGAGPRVLVVRTGVVHTEPTAGHGPAPLTVTPEVVADAVVAGLARGRTVVWVPAAWGRIATVMRRLPGRRRRPPAR
jgi:decaprenylphospho-beta-D-erythro-pentofuranosid-2-ulose 2-reductase